MVAVKICMLKHESECLLGQGRQYEYLSTSGFVSVFAEEGEK